MKRIYPLLLPVLLLSGNFAMASAITARAGQYTVEVNSQPSPPALGENLLLFTVKDGPRPVDGADVRIHVTPRGREVPIDGIALPRAGAGEYGASVHLPVTGRWMVAVRVRPAAPRAPVGDGTAYFELETGTGISVADGGGQGRPWLSIAGGMLLFIMLFGMLCNKRLTLYSRFYIAGVLVLLILLLGLVLVPNKNRRTYMASVFGMATKALYASITRSGVAVTTEKVTRVSFPLHARYIATIYPDIEESICAGAAGQVLALPAVGEQTDAGSLLARLNTHVLAESKTPATTVVGEAARLHARNALLQAQTAYAPVQAKVRAAEQAVIQARQAVDEAQDAVDAREQEINAWNQTLPRLRQLYAKRVVSRRELEREISRSAEQQVKLNLSKAALCSAKTAVTDAQQQLADAESERDEANHRCRMAREAVQVAAREGVSEPMHPTHTAATAGMRLGKTAQADSTLYNAVESNGQIDIRATGHRLITACHVTSGATVQAGKVLLTIADTDVVRMRLTISSTEQVQLSAGQPISIRIADQPAQEVTGHITAVIQAWDAVVHTAVVEARVPNPRHCYRPGVSLVIEVKLTGVLPATPCVPASAVVRHGDQAYVFVATPAGRRMRVKRVMVTTGQVDADRVEIRSGLQSGEEAITSDLDKLRDGEYVRSEK